MLKRRGFTLIELMIGIVLLGIVGMVVARVMASMLRVTTAQIQIAGAQGTARTGALAVPQEFREIGFDTIPSAVGSTSSDLVSIASNRITFRAMRGLGMTCKMTADQFTVTEIWIRLPVFGMRELPAETDSVWLFVENDINQGLDDQWVPLEVTARDESASCGADKAIKLTFNAPKKYPDVLAPNIVASNVPIGGPVRWYEVMEYGPVVDANGRTYLGARSLNQGGALQAMLGPLSDSTGFALTYYDKDGAVLNPATAGNDMLVRSIGISMTSVSSTPLSLAGSSTRSRKNVPVVTRVALRNILRP